MERRLFTSESVTEGHPDKMCDQISDAILDALMEQDPMSRVACETCTTTGLVMVMGEITTNAYVDIQKIVRDTVREIGYTRGKFGFDADTCGVITAIDEQSSDIAMGVDKALEAKENQMSEADLDEIGAGDQGMMFGYASDETPEYMPYPIALAHKLSRRLTEVRKNGTLPYLRPDGKTQVTVEYDESGVPFRLDAVVLSTQHNPEISQEQIHEDIKKHVFDAVIPEGMTDENFHKPNRPVCYWRTTRRQRADRAEADRGHLWRHGAPRRRSLLGQRLHEGGSFCSICGSVRGKKYGGGRTGKEM